MAIPITNDITLMQVLGAEFTKVVDEVAEWLLTQVRESVEANVYGYPEGQYERLGINGGFLGAWGKEATRFVAGYIETMVGIDPIGQLGLEGAKAMEINAQKHQHGNLAGDDRREQLASLIETGSGYDFGGNAAMQRDFWQPIIQIVEDGSLDTALENIMTSHGIQFIKKF